MNDVRRRPGETLAPPDTDCQRIAEPADRYHLWHLVQHGVVRRRLRWRCDRCGAVVRLPGRFWPWESRPLASTGRAAHAALAQASTARWARVAALAAQRGEAPWSILAQLPEHPAWRPPS